MSHLQTYNFISRFKQTKIFQKQCLVLCSLKNLKLFPDIDSFMGVVFHGWIVSTITETNYIFRMLQLVSFFTFSVQYFISKDILHCAGELLSMFEVLCKITTENTRIFNNCLRWHFNLSHVPKQKSSICQNRKFDLHHRHMPFQLSNFCERFCLNSNKKQLNVRKHV